MPRVLDNFAIAGGSWCSCSRARRMIGPIGSCYHPLFFFSFSRGPISPLLRHANPCWPSHQLLQLEAAWQHKAKAAGRPPGQHPARATAWLGVPVGCHASGAFATIYTPGSEWCGRLEMKPARFLSLAPWKHVGAYTPPYLLGKGCQTRVPALTNFKEMDGSTFISVLHEGSLPVLWRAKQPRPGLNNPAGRSASPKCTQHLSSDLDECARVSRAGFAIVLSCNHLGSGRAIHSRPRTCQK